MLNIIVLEVPKYESLCPLARVYATRITIDHQNLDFFVITRVREKTEHMESKNSLYSQLRFGPFFQLKFVLEIVISSNNRYAISLFDDILISRTSSSRTYRVKYSLYPQLQIYSKYSIENPCRKATNL